MLFSLVISGNKRFSQCKLQISFLPTLRRQIKPYRALTTPSEALFQRGWFQSMSWIKNESTTTQLRSVASAAAATKSKKAKDELKCVHFDVCSGCTVNNSFMVTPKVQEAVRFFRTHDVSLKVHLDKITQWRTRAKLAVQSEGRHGGIKFGLYKSGTHEVVAIPKCQVHDDSINRAVEVLKVEAMRVGIKGMTHTPRTPAALSAAASDMNLSIKRKPTLPVSPASVAPTGDLRYIQMTVERVSGKIQLVLVWNAADQAAAGLPLAQLVNRLKMHSSVFHSITVNFQSSTTNGIFNNDVSSWVTVFGPPRVKESVGDATFYFPPHTFRQANLDMFESHIVPRVVDHIPYNSIVAELYSGIGILGLNAAASRAGEVRCSDLNAHVEAVFQRCVNSLPEEDRGKVTFRSLSAEDAIARGQCAGADVLIVDPPRRGLDTAVLKLLTGRHDTQTAEGLKRLIYVSCDLDSLKRDIAVILSSGLWRIRSSDAYVLFPGSDHIETLVIFDKV